MTTPRLLTCVLAVGFCAWPCRAQVTVGVSVSPATRSAPLRELATRPVSEPVQQVQPCREMAGEDYHKFIKDTLAGLEAGTATPEQAETALVRKGEMIVAALKEALASPGQGSAKVLAAALAKLDWKLDVPKLIQDWAKQQNPALTNLPAPVALSNESTTAVLPDVRFYLVAYPSFPVARMPPKPLTSRQVFIVSRAGKVEYAGDVEALKQYFKDNAPAVKNVAAAKAAVVAWLQVSKELAGDGWFQFAISAGEVKVDQAGGVLSATGKAAVAGAAGGARGNQGAVAATIAFGEQGKIKDIDQVANLRAGMRPICQSTKLLDGDPIVRKMARQDLLLMGTDARDYLIDQRAKARPELQEAIDAIWQEILDREHADRNADPRLK
jgi:hypothetical protein